MLLQRALSADGVYLRNMPTPRHSDSSFTKVLFFTSVISLFGDTMHCRSTVTKKSASSTS